MFEKSYESKFLKTVILCGNTAYTFTITNSYYLMLVQPTWITQCPLLLLDTRMPYGSLSIGCEEHLDPAGTGSLYNEGEADIVLQHVFSLIYAGNHV